MLVKTIVLALAGAISVYVGTRLVIAREIRVVHEGSEEPVGRISGLGAVIVGCSVVCFGLYIVAVAFGFVQDP